MDEKQTVNRALMDELYDASHIELFNLCLVLGSEIIFGDYESQGMESIDAYGDEMTDLMMEMLVDRLRAVRRGEHLTEVPES